MKRWLAGCCCLLLLGLLGGCAGVGQPVVWGDPAQNLVWPEPPDQPRVRYLRTMVGSQDFEDAGRKGRLFRWLTGEVAQTVPLISPYGVTADGEGRVWMSDPEAGLVHLFDLQRKSVDYLQGGDNLSFRSPLGVAYDAARKRLLVADGVLKKVIVLDAERGRLLGQWAPPGGFGRPAGIALDRQGQLYVADVLNSQIEIFSPDGTHLRSVRSKARPEEGFNRPANLWVDQQGRIYVVDSMNFQVEVLAADGSPVGTIGALGDTQGHFARPRGIAVDSEGHIYVADASFNNVQIFDLSGKLLLVFGETGKGPGQFSLPAGLFIDGQDRLYVVDSFNQRLQVFEYLPAGKRP